MKSYLTITFFLFYGFVCRAQNWGINTFSQFTNEANDVELNNNQEAYITGYITGETAFNSSNVVPGAAGNGDIYIAKYSPAGTLIWKKTFGGNYSDRAYDLAVGPDQNIVVTGQFFGTVTFGSTTLTSVGNSKDIFVVKLDPQGDVIWARSEGGSMAENAYGITVDHQNNVILTGQFQGTASIGGNSFTSAIDPNNNLYSFDLFVSKYDSNGNPLWSLNGTASYEDRGLAVAVDAQNNIFLTGQFSKTFSFASNTYQNQGYNIGFLCKLNPAGQLQFFNQMKAGLTSPYDLEVNSDNNVIVSGDFLGNMNYYDATGMHGIQNPFEKQIFILKTANNGNYLWDYTLGSNNDLSSRSVSIDLHKDIFVTGYFKCDLSQLQDSSTATFNSVGFKDAYLLKVNDSGDHEYIKHFGGKMDDEGHGVAVYQNDEPKICGSFTKDLNFAPSNNFTTTANNNYSLHWNGNNETPHLYLMGDSTRNSFLVNHVNANYQALNYFSEPTNDSLVGYVVPYSSTANLINDTLHFCTKDSLRYNPLTWNHYGPSYNYVWNTGVTGNKLVITATGDYSVIATRDDECEFDTDSIHAISEPIPVLPLLTDNLGINILHPGPHYNDYHLCYPDSVEITYSNLQAGTSLITQLQTNMFTYSGVGPFTIQNEGLYKVIVSNNYCNNIGDFDLIYDYVAANNPIIPQIAMKDASPSGDSISVCQGTDVFFSGVDLQDNPNAYYDPEMADTVTDVAWYINGIQYSNYSNIRTDFVPSTTGWYTVNVHFSAGYNNLCGLDTTQYHVTRQFYIEVMPQPTWSGTISGDNLLCENGSIFLVIDNPNSNMSWTGPGIIWNNNNDSIEVNEEGTYYFSGTIIDPVSGCTNGFYDDFTIILKTAPHITSDPSDGIVCPYDSVLMNVPDVYLDYQWVGPQGDSLATIHQCYGEDLGFYYVHVTDNEGCHLTSPPFELREYTTPSITIMPDEFLCQGESVTIQVAYAGTPSFVWSPTGGTQDHITVNSPGVYTIQIEQCGITITDSIEIIDGTFSASISSTDSILCFGDSISIQGTPNDFSYEWNNGQITGSSYLVNEAGTYSATVTNEYGCTAQTNSITITQVPESVLPNIESLTVCSGADITLTDTSLFTLNWYNSSDTSFIITNNEFHLVNLTQDTSFVVAYQSSTCPLAYGTVSVLLLDTLGNYEIFGDSLLCQNENGLFSINTTTENITWYANQQAIGSNNPIQIPFSTLETDPVISVQISNECYTTSISDSVIILPQAHISLQNDSITLCYYDTEIVTLDNTDLDSVIWTSSLGTVYDEDFTLTGDNTYGNISVYAFDNNGCQTDTASLTVITPNFNSTIHLDFSNYCLGDSGTLSVQTNADSLIWTTPFGTFDTTTLSFTIDSQHSGMYYLEQWDNLGCHYTDSVFIPLYQFPEISILPDSIFCLNDVFTFYFPNDTNTYSWMTYGNSTDIPILFDQNLILTVTSPNGCMAFDTLVVHTINCVDELPNFITANGDGTNDVFFIDEAPAQKDNELVILNRYGNRVFEAQPYTNDFDGGNLHEGVYFYIYYPDGKKSPDNYRQGFLEIIRD
jgi:gliding motility-associated-like protein